MRQGESDTQVQAREKGEERASRTKKREIGHGGHAPKRNSGAHYCSPPGYRPTVSERKSSGNLIPESARCIERPRKYHRTSHGGKREAQKRASRLGREGPACGSEGRQLTFNSYCSAGKSPASKTSRGKAILQRKENAGF